MNLTKHSEFFDPTNDLKHPIHIIGCGAIGSTVAEMLARMGVPKLHIYDFDTVTAHNIANQMYSHYDINAPKVNALDEIVSNINPELEVTMHEQGYKDQPLAGYVFLCVDNIELRKQIVESNRFNTNIKAMFDFRMRLTDAQHYAADWSNSDSITKLLNTMNFSHAEAKEATPISACGTTLNIVPTVRVIVSLGLSNFINFVKDKKLKSMILADSFHFIVDAF